MTTISYDRSHVYIVTPRGTLRYDVSQAQKLAAMSGNEHELEEAIQNPDVAVAVIATTRARGLRGPHTAVCQ